MTVPPPEREEMIPSPRLKCILINHTQPSIFIFIVYYWDSNRQAKSIISEKNPPGASLLQPPLLLNIQEISSQQLNLACDHSRINRFIWISNKSGIWNKNVPGGERWVSDIIQKCLFETQEIVHMPFEN